MKYFRSLSIAVLMVVTSSCNLDLLDDPNAVKLSGLAPSLLLNQIQVDLALFFNGASTFGMQVTRLQNSGGAFYENFATPQGFDNVWTNGYANVLTDCDVLIKQADASRFTVHAGMARIMQAYTLSVLVDYFGDVPFSQAFQGAANLNPGVDRMVDLYPAIIAILDKAITDLGTTPDAFAPAITDFYYGGGTAGIAKWRRLANTLKLKLGLNLKNQNPSLATTLINQALAAGVITAQGDSFVFRYGPSDADPDARHPRFTNNYITGANDYMANYLMWQMFYGYDMNDPRMRFYFYRQRGANSSDPNEIRCVAQTSPGHYPFVAGTSVIYGVAGVPPGISPASGNPAWARYFCQPTPIGYWGREHVDPQGIPPDGLARTTWGPYPVGGRFDANTNAGVNNPALGMRGAGIQPMLMRSAVNFMRAEIALSTTTLGGVTGAGTAASQFELGITNSLTDVRDWSINGTLGTNAFGSSPGEASTINGFFPTAGTALVPVRAASTANLTFVNGIPTLGLRTIDGVALIDGDRVLLKDQSVASQNGIWIVTSSVWTRATDADAPGELAGATVTVSEGTSNINARFVQVTPSTATAPIVVGTTAINWRSPLADEFARYTARANAAFAAQTTDADRLNFVAREYWISLFGCGVEAYNLYRRTGLPTGMQPTVNPSPGSFPRTFWYPASFESRNSQVEQKSNLSGKVFWDTFVTNLNF